MDDSEEGRKFERTLPLATQRQAWTEQKGFIAIDYVKGDVDTGSKYVVLARLSAELYDANCVGLYLPRENTLVPGEGAARDQLNKIIAYQEVDVT
jgi:hypothetical protein